MLSAIFLVRFETMIQELSDFFLSYGRQAIPFSRPRATTSVPALISKDVSISDSITPF